MVLVGFIGAVRRSGFAGCLWSIIIRSSQRVYGEHYFDTFLSFGITGLMPNLLSFSWLCLEAGVYDSNVCLTFLFG